MFGLFTKRKSKADAVIEIMDDVIAIAAQKWLTFCEQLPFKEDVPLVDRISAFGFPLMQGAREKVPALREAPDGVLLLIVAMGVDRSGTHTKALIEEALGISWPS